MTGDSGTSSEPGKGTAKPFKGMVLVVGPGPEPTAKLLQESACVYMAIETSDGPRTKDEREREEAEAAEERERTRRMREGWKAAAGRGGKRRAPWA